MMPKNRDKTETKQKQCFLFSFEPYSNKCLFHRIDIKHIANRYKIPIGSCTFCKKNKQKDKEQNGRKEKRRG